MGWNSQVVLATLVIIQGDNDGLFVYDGTPADGDLIAAIAGAAGSDEYGNNYPQGILQQSPGATIIKITGGQVIFDNDSARTAGAISGYLDAIDAGTPQIEIVSAIGTTVDAYAGKLLTGNGDVSHQAIYGIYQMFAAFNPSSGYPNLETWHNVGNSNGWSGGRYAFMPYGVTNNMVWVNGTLTAGTTVADGTSIGTVATDYIPASAQNLPVVTNNALATAGDQSPHFVVETSGQIHCFGIRATGDVIGVNCGYPLD